MGVRAAAVGASGAIQCADLLAQAPHHGLRRLAVGHEVQVLDLLPDDPVGHRVDVVAYGITAQPIRLDERGAAAHERVGDPNALQVVGAKKGLGEPLLAELREQQAPEQRPRPPGKPLVHRNDRAGVLLNLLSPQGKVCDERYVKNLLYQVGSLKQELLGSYLWKWPLLKRAKEMPPANRPHLEGVNK